MSLQIRVRGPNGQNTVSISPEQTVSSFLDTLSTAAGVDASSISLKGGFPPKPVPIPSDRSSNAIIALGLSRGDSLTIAADSPLTAPSQTSDTSSGSQPFRAQPVAPAPASATTSSSSNDKQVKGTHVAAPHHGGSLVIRVAPDDNSCLFHALGFLVLPTDPNPNRTLRRQVAEHIASNPFDYSDAILGQPRDAYMSTIQKDSSWGGAIELSVLSAVHRVEIDAVDVQSGRIDRYGQDQYSNRALLLYSGIHYDSASVSPLPPDSFDMLDFDTRLFSTETGDDILACLTALASELRRKRYYTDTANFTLKCEICKKGLVGQKEAQSHAMQTGHAAFGEY